MTEPQLAPATAVCRNCGDPITYGPFYPDAYPGPNPPVWRHDRGDGIGAQICATPHLRAEPAASAPEDVFARLHAAAARAEAAAGLTDVEECRIAHSGRASGLREALRIIGEQPQTTANNSPTSTDAPNNPLREQYAAVIRSECGSRFGYVTEQLLAVHERDTAQLRAERDMALKAAREARGDVAHDAGPSVAECRDQDRRWDVEQAGE
ncbi:hypothetical protein [Streptomyces liliifuscus]|uniref:Uncharacterized protein n=1 Tax=Streptomyces liliifuscus TaxID=2797636 RepID=A0A7T7L2C1_9ACTN|nr:hypothetical protein [Streptomyces liliifuscus]QQM45142.1 hypothetical protein JEQ17_40925 [Streptomyces liliifuscus]